MQLSIYHPFFITKFKATIMELLVQSPEKKLKHDMERR